MASDFHVFRGPQDEVPGPSPVAGSGDGIAIRFGEILPLLQDAADKRRTWLEDFRDDAVTVSRDLYEVIQAYAFYRRCG